MPTKSMNSEADERYAALLSNAGAIRALASAVEGTIGPKGLDTMLVDRYGDVLITNAGVTILEKMDVNHPAAMMLIKVAKAQQEEIGDGTTTATLVASSLISAGVEQVLRGVPVARVIEGIRFGLQEAMALLQQQARPLVQLDSEQMVHIALVAGREHRDIADLVVEAARLIGENKLKDPSFRLAETISAKANIENEVFLGVVIDKERLNRDMPLRIDQPLILVLDDALEPEELSAEAQSTESGFAHFRELQQEFRQQIAKLITMGVKVILCEKNVDSYAEEVLCDAGIMVVSRVPLKPLRRVADHTGARMLKRSGLKRNAEDLLRALGKAQCIEQIDKYSHIRVTGGEGQAIATVLVGAATPEVVGERERIAKDAASSVQAAIKGGVVPGGGATELYLARQVSQIRDKTKGMASYGVDCVVEALKRPFAQIVTNAGFNPLEKVEEAAMAQTEQGTDTLAIDCDTGQVTDMFAAGILDPVQVKLHALKAAGEIAEAILRIETIIKKRDDVPSAGDMM